jgi:hypothetical protein
LRQLEKVKTGEFVFAGQARNKPLSNMAMETVLRRMKIEDATVHGFRSSFRDWAGNVSNFPREVVETALAHVIGDKAEQAYRRSDALEKRRKLMEAWASYCDKKGGKRRSDPAAHHRLRPSGSKRLAHFRSRRRGGHSSSLLRHKKAPDDAGALSLRRETDQIRPQYFATTGFLPTGPLPTAKR